MIQINWMYESSNGLNGLVVLIWRRWGSGDDVGDSRIIPGCGSDDGVYSRDFLPLI